MRKLLLGLSITLILIGCDALIGEEIGRISFKQTSNIEQIIREITLDLKEGEKISFWTETDIEYENELTLIYTVELWIDSKEQGGFKMNALETNPTMMEIKKSFGNETSWSYTGKMNHLTIKEDGNYTFKAVLHSSENNNLKINKAELVLKK
ncbi:hypothetical protein [Aquimarina megaterium]|uniref:hypothetical protein n=1 Tax=Aquimarina megaterium TaxID=1443666 RepID=UPI0009438F78|nr:hypothetical protein [Aquimarina megaterium]